MKLLSEKLLNNFVVKLKLCRNWIHPITIVVFVILLSPLPYLAAQCAAVPVCRPRSPLEQMMWQYQQTSRNSMTAHQEYLRAFSIWRTGVVAKQNQMKQIRQERRIKYKAMEEVREKTEMESARQLAEQKEKEEEKKYRIFYGRNGARLDAKVVAVSPYVRKAKLQDRRGATYVVALTNFSDEDQYYLKSWVP